MATLMVRDTIKEYTARETYLKYDKGDDDSRKLYTINNMLNMV